MEEKAGKYAHGVGYIFLSVFSLSLFLLFAKLGTANTPFFLLSFFRFLVPLLLLLPFLYYQGLFKEFSLFRGTKSHFLRCSCVLIQQYTVFYYLLYGSLLDITVLLNLSPIIVALLERIIFKHPIHKSVAISLLVSFVGALCVLQPDKGIFSLLSFVGLIAALASGTSQVVYGHNARKEPTSVSLFYLFFIGSIVSFLVLLIYQAFANESVVKATSSFLFGDWAPLLFLLALSLCTITNQSFRGLAYQHGRPAVLAPFLYFSVFFSALFDWLIFHNTLNTLEIVGILLILLGGFLQIFLRKVAHFK